MTPDLIRYALDQLRADTNARLDNLSSKMDALDEKLDTTRDELLPRVAGVEAQVATRRSRADRNWKTWVAVGVSLLALIGTFIQPLIGG